MKFIYKGRDNNRNIIQGIIDAPTRREALIELKGEQKIVTVFLLKEKKEIPAIEFLKKRTEVFRENIKNKTTKMFTVQKKKKQSQEAIWLTPEIATSLTKDNTIFNVFIPEVEEAPEYISAEKPQFRKKTIKKEVGKKTFALPKEIIPPKRYNQKFKIPSREIKVFFEHLALLLSSGVPISKALTSLEKQIKNKNFKKIIGFIYKEIQAGNPLSYAIACFPQQFNRFSVSMVTIGETSGTLDKCLADIAKFMDKQLKVKNTIKGAMVYPIIVLVVLFIMMFLGSLFFIPMFSALFVDLGMELPMLTRVIFWVAERLYIVIIAALMLSIIISVLKKNKAVNIRYVKVMDNLLLSLPLIKGTAITANMFHFSYALALMLKNGIRIIDSLHLTADIVNNIYIKGEIKDSIKMLTEGIKLSEALEQQPHFSDIVTNVISVGEESGQMEYVLNQISEYYSEQLNLQINMLMQYIQPMAILLVAAIAVPVVFAIFIPLLDISSGQFME